MTRPPVPVPPSADAARSRASAPRSRAPHARARAAVAVLAALTLTGTVSGCDLRLESPPPATPSLDAAQQARQDAATAAADLADAGVAALAAAAAAPTGADPAATAAWLQRVVDVSTDHLEALGGVWVPFPSASPAPTPTSTTPAEPSPAAVGVADVVDLLARTAAQARDQAELTDPDLARLLGSVAAARTVLAERLAAAAGIEAPLGQDVEPALPAGLAASDVADLVASHDALGYAWEVAAARADGDVRSSAAARAAGHREEAEAWARLADLDGTGLDPRRAAYDLPDALLDPAADDAARLAALAALEDGLAATYASLVAQADAGARAVPVSGLTDVARTGVELTGQLPALPGTTAPAA